MYKVAADIEKNRLYVKLKDIGTGEGRLLNNDIKSEIEKLKPGFAVVSDIRKFIVKDPNEGIWAGKIIQSLVKEGMKIAIRVTGRKGNSKKGRNESGYVVFIAETIEEADQILDHI